MALIEDMFKGNLAAGLAIGVGAIIFGPTVIQATDLVAEARAELDQEASAGRQPTAKTGAAAAPEHQATA
jgi:hypothetical protein